MSPLNSPTFFSSAHLYVATSGATAHVPEVTAVHEPLLCLILGTRRTTQKRDLVTAQSLEPDGHQGATTSILECFVLQN